MAMKLLHALLFPKGLNMVACKFCTGIGLSLTFH